MQTNFIETETRKRGELAPARLGEKLRRIREDYDLTQGKMLLIINPTETCETNRARVSQYENGTRVPSLVELYNYARFAGVTMETLVNDELDLPATTRQTSDEQNDPERRAEETETLQNTIDKLSPPAVESEPSIQPSETCLMPLSIEMLGRCRKMYFELLEELPFDRYSQLTFDGLIEHIFAVVVTDYSTRQMESEIARRVLMFVEKCRIASA